MTIQDFYKLVKAGKAILIDVREEYELKESGIIELAEWLPCSKINEGEDDWCAIKAKLPKDKKIGLYCRSGNRSGRVAQMLQMGGLDSVNLGGFKDWQSLGMPVRKFT